MVMSAEYLSGYPVSGTQRLSTRTFGLGLFFAEENLETQIWQKKSASKLFLREIK